MGFKQEIKTLKKGFQEMQRKARERKELADYKRLEKLKEYRERLDKEAERSSAIMSERAKIKSARATIMKAKAQTPSVSKWLMGTGQYKTKKVPIRAIRKVAVKKPHYIFQGGVAYPIARMKTKGKRKAVKRIVKPRTLSITEEWNNLLK